jgi:hypothetical protein
MITTEDVKRIGLKVVQKLTRTAKRRNRVRAHYDFFNRAIAITSKNKTRLAKAGVMLSDVKFHVTEGTRVGCQDTGRLGFVSGNLAREDMSDHDVRLLVDENRATQVVYDGNRFVQYGSREPITKANRIVILDKGMYVF